MTKQILEQGRSSNGAWSLKQLRALGIVKETSRKFPPSGWKRRLVGQDVPDHKIKLFLSLKDKHLKGKKKKRLVFKENELNQEVWSHLNSIHDEIHGSTRSITYSKGL